jgi:hypothetical protein
MSRVSVFPPALEEFVFDFNKIEYLSDGLIDDVAYGFGVVVE